MGSFCKNCGKELEEGVRFCKTCGTPVGGAVSQTSSGTGAQGMYQQPVNINVSQQVLTEKTLPDQFKPLGMWKYFWLQVLFSIPVIGLIFTIVFACGGGRNVNLKYFARSRFCVLILVLIFAAIAVAIAFGSGAIDYLEKAKYLNSLY